MSHHVSIIPEKQSAKSSWGDLISKSGLTIIENTVSVKFDSINARIIYQNSYKNRGHIKIFENTNPMLGTILIFGDSFSDQFLMYAAEIFSKTIFIHASVLDYKLIAYIKPDFVLIEQVERFLIKVPNDISGLDITGVDGDSLFNIYKNCFI
jgi:hypothetical protein